MPIQIDILELFIAVLLLIITIFLVPMMIQVRNTSQRFEEFLRESQRDLLPMLKDLRAAAEHLNTLANKVEEGVARTGPLMEALEEVGDSLHRVNSFFRHDVGRYAGSLASLWLGFRSASKIFVKQMVKEKKGGE